MKAVVIGATVTLCEGERAVCELIANARHTNNRNAGVHNAQRCAQSRQDVEISGIGSELAFCRLFGIYPDLSTHIRSGAKGEDHGDATLPSGQTVDVKSTKYDTGRLLVLPWTKKTPPDFYVLMTGTFPTYTFRGFMRAEEIRKPERIKNLGYGNSYAADQNELKTLEELC